MYLHPIPPDAENETQPDRPVPSGGPSFPDPSPAPVWAVWLVGGVAVAHWIPTDPGDSPAQVTAACGAEFTPARILGGDPVLETPCTRCRKAADTSTSPGAAESDAAAPGEHHPGTGAP